jgi:membrane-bound lytic murein transglycosylase D
MFVGTHSWNRHGVVLAFALALLTSCASMKHTDTTADNGKAASPSETAADAKADKDAKSAKSESVATEKGTADDDTDSDEVKAADIENQTIEDVIRIEEPNTQTLYDNSRYDFPITINSRVEGWIDYFTGRGREHMERYLSRSSRYIPIMKQILKKSGLPEDLVYLALIESGFNLRANSRARAVGPWQFMKETGRRYGLRVDAWVDERRDPIRSTEAAANYLKDLYLMFESWYLAAAAYNAGEYKILRAIDQGKTNNFWHICQTHLLRKETKDYIPKLIAAAIIAKNPAKYGFEDIAYLEPLEYETVSVDFPMPLSEIAKLVDSAEDDLEELNPQLRRGMVPPGGEPYEVRVPVGSRVLVERALSAIRTKLAQAALPIEHVVRHGETLASVARRYHLRARELANANNLGPREKLKPGATLLIPNRAKLASQTSDSDEPKLRHAVSVKPNEAGFIFHTVRRGESLWSISEKYDVTVQDLFRWNDLRRSKLMPGKKLKIKSNGPPVDQATEGRANPRNRRRRFS